MLQLGYKVLRMELIFLIFEVEMMDRGFNSPVQLYPRYEA